MKFNFFHAGANARLFLGSYGVECLQKQIWADFVQKWLSYLQMKFALYTVKVGKKISSEEKMTLIKVAANDPSYCSKFSFHGRNMKNEDVRAKKPQFLPFFRKMAKNLRFYAIALSFFIFRPWNENLEQ